MSADAPDARYQPPISQDLATRHVSVFMTKKVVTANPVTTVKVAIQMMLQHAISGLPVVDNSGHCVGVYSEVDALLQGASGPLNVPIHFTPKLLAVKENTHYKDALILMAKHRVKRLPVIDDRRHLVGVISRSDLLRGLYEDQMPPTQP